MACKEDEDGLQMGLQAGLEGHWEGCEGHIQVPKYILHFDSKFVCNVV